jgi:hypothetical protein
MWYRGSTYKSIMADSLKHSKPYVACGNSKPERERDNYTARAIEYN